MNIYMPIQVMKIPEWVIALEILKVEAWRSTHFKLQCGEGPMVDRGRCWPPWLGRAQLGLQGVGLVYLGL